MADIIRLSILPDIEASRPQLLDLQRRLEAGEDLGPRAIQIRQIAATLRVLSGGLRRKLEVLDPLASESVQIRVLAEEILGLAEQNVASAECLLRALDPHADRER